MQISSSSSSSFSITWTQLRCCDSRCSTKRTILFVDTMDDWHGFKNQRVGFAGTCRACGRGSCEQGQGATLLIPVDSLVMVHFWLFSAHARVTQMERLRDYKHMRYIPIVLLAPSLPRLNPELSIDLLSFIDVKFFCTVKWCLDNGISAQVTTPVTAADLASALISVLESAGQSRV